MGLKIKSVARFFGGGTAGIISSNWGIGETNRARDCKLWGIKGAAAGSKMGFGGSRRAGWQMPAQAVPRAGVGVCRGQADRPTANRAGQPNDERAARSLPQLLPFGEQTRGAHGGAHATRGGPQPCKRQANKHHHKCDSHSLLVWGSRNRIPLAAARRRLIIKCEGGDSAAVPGKSTRGTLKTWLGGC